MRYHFGVSLCVRFRLTSLVNRPLLSFTAQASKQASPTSPPPCQPCKLESRDMTCFNPCAFYGCPLHGWMWWPTFPIRTMGAARLTSSLNMLQEIGGRGSLYFVLFFLLETTSTIIPVSTHNIVHIHNCVLCE